MASGSGAVEAFVAGELDAIARDMSAAAPGVALGTGPAVERLVSPPSEPAAPAPRPERSPRHAHHRRLPARHRDVPGAGASGAGLGVAQPVDTLPRRLAAVPARAAPGPVAPAAMATRPARGPRARASAEPSRARWLLPAPGAPTAPAASAAGALGAAASLFLGLWSAVLLLAVVLVVPRLRRRFRAPAGRRRPRPRATRLERPG
jgi:hypothetical protein